MASNIKNNLNQNTQTKQLSLKSIFFCVDGKITL